MCLVSLSVSVNNFVYAAAHYALHSVSVRAKTFYFCKGVYIYCNLYTPVCLKLFTYSITSPTRKPPTTTQLHGRIISPSAPCDTLLVVRVVYLFRLTLCPYPVFTVSFKSRLLHLDR